mgnify:CR=1 FL=1
MTLDDSTFRNIFICEKLGFDHRFIKVKNKLLILCGGMAKILNPNFSSFSTILYSLVRNIYELNLPIPISFCIYVFSSKYMVGNSTTEFHLSATMHATSALRVRIFTWPDRHLLVPKITLSKEDVHTHCATYVIVQSFIPWDPSMQYTICSVDA